MRTACWIALAFSFGTADAAWACSCFSWSPCELYSTADAVFLGKVVNVRVEGPLLAARLEVTRVWKGTVDPVVTVTNPAGSSCSFHFVLGARYVVYGGGAGSTFTTHVCAGGGQLRPGEPDPDLPPLPGSVTGEVSKYKEVIRDRDDLTDPVVGARVWLESGAGVKETHSDAGGAFTLSGVGAGDHTVHADFGAELEGSANVSLRSSDDCGRVLITPSPAGHIVGRLTSEDGQPIRDTELHAIPIDHDWTQHDLTEVRNATSAQNGEFEFRGVKSGQYVVAVNTFQAPLVKQPFPPTYYPGVEKREDATIIHVGGGNPSPREPFVLKRTLPRTVIVADILCRDGSVPRSALLYAKVADEWTFTNESTYEQVDGHLRLTVMHGMPYEVHGVVLIPARDASGREMGVTSLRTPTVLIDSSAPPPVIRLVAPLDRCQRTTIDGSRR